MKKTRKMSKKHKFWLWFPLYFNICMMVLALINIFTDSELLKLIVQAMIYLAPWLLFIQAKLEVRERWHDWAEEVLKSINYLEGYGRIFLMINKIKDEQTKTELMEEYKTIFEECIMVNEVDDTSEL